ncbi:neprilysin-11-like [Orbicella faveolata]|uniref:neprilysin-11-like n=1 Tax=Orbicella faveolata TaxID=48498 RepID=UPI0009E1CCD4|nr:neprilysin-11-like [Orbicella faveolata]
MTTSPKHHWNNTTTPPTEQPTKPPIERPTKQPTERPTKPPTELPTTLPTPTETQPRICNTAKCYQVAEVISNQLNKTMDPCDDFYSYACGGFFKTHHLGVNQSNVGGFTIVNDDNMEVLRRAMETAASNNSQVWHEVDLS